MTKLSWSQLNYKGWEVVFVVFNSEQVHFNKTQVSQFITAMTTFLLQFKTYLNKQIKQRKKPVLILFRHLRPVKVAVWNRLALKMLQTDHRLSSDKNKGCSVQSVCSCVFPDILPGMGKIPNISTRHLHLLFIFNSSLTASPCQIQHIYACIIHVLL